MEHAESYVSYFSTYPATFTVDSPRQQCPRVLIVMRTFELNANSPSPLAMPGVQDHSQGSLHDEGTLRPDAHATYPTSHSNNIPWNEANAVNGHDSHPGMVSEDMDPIAHLPMAAFVNLSMLNDHQGILGTSNQSHILANGSTGSGQSTASASVPQQGIPAAAGGHRFECEDCHKTFDRLSRLDNCRNRHRGIKPYQCRGRCIDPSCRAKYASVDYLRRHLLPNEERCIACTNCHQNISKQNMARHKASCV